MSEHSVNVVKITNLRQHPNADALDIINIGQYQAVVRRETFALGDLAVYIEPDYVVPTHREEFAFLARPNKIAHRLKAVRLRGEISHGLLIPIPADIKEIYAAFGGVKEGDDLMNDLEIKRWEPEQRLVMRADQVSHEDWPDVGAYGRQKFDVEGMKKAEDWFTHGEPVLVTEKVHGANARYVFIDGKFYVGSRSQWLKPEGEHPWARVLSVRPDIERWCRNHPSTILYGEVYGKVQSLKYGLPNDVDFIAFAAWSALYGDWADLEMLFSSFSTYDLVHVPVLYKGPFTMEAINAIKERDSVVAQERGITDHMMEGVVITPVSERWAGRAYDQRCVAKVISDRYWELKD